MPNPIIATMTLTKVSADTPFDPPLTTEEVNSFQAYLRTTYTGPGKILSRMSTMSPDSLTRTTMTVWKTDDERKAYNEDRVILERRNRLLDHCRANSIKVSWSNQEIEEGIVIREWAGTFVE